MTQLKRTPTVIFNLVISTFILAMLLLGNGKMSVELVLFSTVVCMVLTKTGEFSLRICQLTEIKARLPLSFVIGFVVISLPMVAMTLLFNISALSAFAISAVSILILNAYFPSKVAECSSNDWGDTAIALILAIIIGLLAKIPVSSPTTLLYTGVLPIWSDYFIHGVTIASFGSRFATGFDMELAGVSRAFYHYSPFMIPAAFQSVSGMSGLALATSLLLPLGLLVAAFGSYVFAVELSGRVGALLALTAIICLPASSVFIQSGWFDFYWLLFIAPGSGYAIGVSMAVCTLVASYLNKNDRRFLWLALFLLFSLILMRAHMFILLAPVIVALIFIHRWARNISIIVFVAFGILIIGTLTIYFLPNLHALWIEICNPHVYLNNVSQWALFYGLKIPVFEHPFLTFLSQLLLVLVAMLGIYCILYPLFLGISVRRFGFRIIDVLPLLMIICFIGLMLFSPIARNGDITEYKHRHFLLLYVVIALYTIAYAYKVLEINYSQNYKFRIIIYALVICVYFITIPLNWGKNPARPNIDAMPWAGSCHMQQITPGVLESAEYIQSHARYGDVIAMGSTLVESTLSDPVVEVISLSGIPAFIARPGLRKKGSRHIREIVFHRLKILQELSLVENWDDARKYLQTNGIRWFLVPNGEQPKWDLGLKNVAFASNGMSVYDADFSTN